MTEWPGHRAYLGITGSGKTTAATIHAQSHRGPMILWDPQDEDKFGVPRADGQHHAWVDIWEGAGRGGVRFVPDPDPERGRAQLSLVVDRLMHVEHDPPVLLVVDEADIYAPEGGRAGPIDTLARRGRRWGLVLWVLSRRPAEIAKAVVAQCGYVYIFELSSFDYQALRRHGIPGEEVQQKLESAEKWSFCCWDSRYLTGPFNAIAPDGA